MKIMVFLHGTTIMHKSGKNVNREERSKQVIENEASVLDFVSYIPIGNAVEKINIWEKQGSEIYYLSSHQNYQDVQKDKLVLNKFGFPDAIILWRQNGEQYKDLAEKIQPDVLIEDDCECIGGVEEMTITHVSPEIKERIKSITVKEFGGIDHLPDEVNSLLNF